MFLGLLDPDPDLQHGKKKKNIDADCGSGSSDSQPLKNGSRDVLKKLISSA
jgi:hypothetical protein